LGGWRPKVNNMRDKICLSFFVSETNLDLDQFALAEGDPYLSYWLINLNVLLDRNYTQQKLLAANQKLLINFPDLITAADQDIKQEVNQKHTFQLVTFLETASRKIQFKFFPSILKKLANQDSWVVVNDEVLKLHSNDRRYNFKDQWKLKIKELEIQETKQNV
jgi:hypothetical protein